MESFGLMYTHESANFHYENIFAFPASRGIIFVSFSLQNAHSLLASDKRKPPASRTITVFPFLCAEYSTALFLPGTGLFCFSSSALARDGIFTNEYEEEHYGKSMVRSLAGILQA